MSMAELVAAGAPELPEGWFYRVSPSGLPGMIRVEVRRARLIGSAEVTRSVVLPHEHMTDMAAVVFGCRNAEARMILRSRAGIENYYGDHDPKGGR
jgi:hypothetical protein